MAEDRRGQVAPWSTLLDGPCELIATFLPRIARLACRLVCRSWRNSFTYALTPLSLDTRIFAARTDNGTGQGLAIDQGANTRPESQGPLDPAWHSLIAAIGPALPSFTVRVSLCHESKARAAPDAAALIACLRYLASLPCYSQERLQLLLPLRYAIPDAALDVLSRDLSHLRRLRLVRCSLTQQLAASLRSMPHLRHLCIAHANLAALPQLLAAATQLQHLHVHGYHSLVIVEDNAHQQATLRAAAALVARGHLGQQPRQSRGRDGVLGSEGAAGGSDSRGGEGGGGRRLHCLAISAHHLNHDTVLDEAELKFEAEALRWQIRYDGTQCGYVAVTAAGDGCNDCNEHGVSGEPGTGFGALGVQWRGAACGGCWIDPHENPNVPSSQYGGSPPRSGSGSGPGGLGVYMGGGSGGASLCAAALVGLTCECCCVKGAGGFGGGRVSRSRASERAVVAEVLGGVRPPQAAPALAGPMGIAGAVGRGGGEEANVALAGIADYEVAGCWRKSAVGEGEGALTLLKSGQREVRLHPRAQLAELVRQQHWQNLQYVQLKLVSEDEPPPPPPPSVNSSGMEVDEAGGVTLEALNVRPACTGVWLDPDEWDGEIALEDIDRQVSGGQVGGSQGAPPTALEVRWGRVGDVWVRLYNPPSPTAAHAFVQDAASHVALLTACRHLTSLALGDRRTPFLGIGYAAAGQLAAQLTSLTKLHLAGGYTLPLGDDVDNTAVVQPSSAAPPPPSLTPPPTTHVDGGQWLQLPPRLAPLGALSHLQRLGLHFGNPLRRPAVISQTALPASLTSLSLHGVVLLPDDAATVAITTTTKAGVASNPLGLTSAVAAAYGTAHGGSAATRSNQPLHVAAPGIRSPPQSRNQYQGSSDLTEGPLRHLRELYLTSSYIARADLLGCGPRLWLLSLRNSGLNAADTGAPHDGRVGCMVGRSGGGGRGGGGGCMRGAARRHVGVEVVPMQAGGALGGDVRTVPRGGVGGGCRGEEGSGSSAPVVLLRRWCGIQTLRVVGDTLAAADTQLPGQEYCLNWQPAAGLAATLSCLPGLRMLHISVPEAAYTPTRTPTNIAVSHSERTAATATGNLVGAATNPAATNPAATNPAATNPAATNPAAADLAVAGPHRPHHDLLHRQPLPLWHLTTLPHPPPPHHNLKTTATSITATAAATADAIATAGTAAAAATAAATNSTSTTAASRTQISTPPHPPPPITSNPPSSPSTSPPSIAHPVQPLGPICRSAAGALGPHGLDSSNLATTSWLGNLLNLLAQYPLHLTSLRVSCTAGDRASAEHAVHRATALLPYRLPGLEQLEIILDIALSYILAQPSPELYAREWAGWLRGEEQVLQARMRHTCVSLTPQPNLVSRAREAARAAAQQTGGGNP